MIASVMLSNKSQYILSKIGIPLFEDATNPSVNAEINIHFFQKDNILTLHLNSEMNTQKKRETYLKVSLRQFMESGNQPRKESLLLQLQTHLIKHFFKTPLLLKLH
jgi:hypothetical protein